MGHNRGGVKRKARLKRHKREVERLLKTEKAPAGKAGAAEAGQAVAEK